MLATVSAGKQAPNLLEGVVALARLTEKLCRQLKFPGWVVGDQLFVTGVLQAAARYVRVFFTAL